jgi:phosphate transport system permease protein
VVQARLDAGEGSEAERRAAEAETRVQEAVAEETRRLDGETASLRDQNAGWNVEFETAAGGVTSVPLDGIVRAWQPNRLGLAGRLGVYASRWGEFLADDPREANSAGGVFPAIWGTVTMTLIMAMLVAPFGVLAALYLREYATSGPIVTAVRIAINNLAGVPSIVYGAFGLGFFCYGLGAGIDELFFQASTVADGQPVFGTGGLLWASLTLALLTLPVVIVATEEALSAVPNSMREGSYACGAGKWQTIRRIVLPRALPGIMTGLILAMARGAGEVAPLMLVGVKKLAPSGSSCTWPT